MISVSELLSSHLKVVRGNITGKCIVCGKSTEAGFDLSKLSANFSSWGLLQHNGNNVCEYCMACISGDGFAGKALRNYSVTANYDDLVILSHENIAQYITSPLLPPFIFIVSFSKKKHIFLSARVNYQTANIFVATDKYNILVNVEEFTKLYGACQELVDNGLSKTEILSGIYRKWNKIEAFPKYYSLESIIKPYRKTFLLDFVLYAVKNKEKNDDKN